MTAPSRATTDKVARAWLATVPGFSLAMVGRRLPEQVSTWASTGFITTAPAGGKPSVDLPVAAPVVMLSCWAVDPDTGDPPDEAANQLAEDIRDATQSPLAFGQVLDLPACDQRAKVLAAYLVSEIRPSYGDMGDYACVVCDLHIDWVALPPQ